MNSKTQLDSLSNDPKCTKETVRDAKEKAKRLLKSGAIGPIIKVPNHTDRVF